ncbi:MAG: SBBP repeat-containing protein, partial [Candidatus Hodarchaeales archaeon]
MKSNFSFTLLLKECYKSRIFQVSLILSLLGTGIFLFANSVFSFPNPMDSSFTNDRFQNIDEVELTREELNPLLNSLQFGSSGNDIGVAVATDNDGNILLTGYTSSNDLPTQNGYQSMLSGDYDVFLTKYSSSGVLLWNTYLGGSKNDLALDIGVDFRDNGIIVTGWTSSSDFPVINPLQDDLAGQYDIFIAKFTSSGILEFSTFYGGSAGEEGMNIAINDQSGQIIIAGRTMSLDFPLLNAFQTKKSGTGFNAFIISLNTTSVLFSTYLGGNSTDSALAVTTGANNEIYITGITESTDFPLFNSEQLNFQGSSDVFLTKMSNNGSLLFSTYFGGDGHDSVFDIGLNFQGDVFITGTTNSNNISNLEQIYGSLNNTDIYLAQFSSTGEIKRSVLIGGQQEDRANALEIDRFGNIFVSGRSNSSDFPIKDYLSSDAEDNNYDGFLMKLDETFSLSFSTYIGGIADDQVLDIKLTSEGHIILTGRTTSNNFPFSKGTFAGKKDTFLSIIGDLSDEDLDDIPNWWENLMGLNPTIADSHEDFDLDGLPNIWEYKNALNASDPSDSVIDYDFDKLPTFWEYQMDLDPFNSVDTYKDFDNDGLINLWEFNHGFQANFSADADYDTDNDGLNNLQEFLLGTNPNKSDSDNDGFSDGIENLFNGLLGSPLDSQDSPLTRIAIILMFFFGLIFLVEILFTSTKQFLMVKKQKYLEKVSQGASILSDFLIDLESLNIQLIDFEGKLQDDLGGKDFQEQKRTFRSFIGLIQDLELERKKIQGLQSFPELKNSLDKVQKTRHTNYQLYSQIKLILDNKEAQLWDRQNKVKVKNNEITCYYCGAIINSTTKECPYCDNPSLICHVCKRNIQFGDEIGACLYCENDQFHFQHLAETVKIIGKCPI